MKELPKIYKNKVEKDTNLKTYYSSDGNEKQEKVIISPKRGGIEETLEEIFKSKAYTYTKKVMITVNGKTYPTRFISRNQNKILTIDNEIIEVSQIEAIDIIDR